MIPAKQWQEARRRLNEEAMRTAKLLLNRTGLKGEGVELPYKLKPGIGARNNFTAALQMVNDGINKRVGEGRKRPEWSSEQCTAAIEVLPDVRNGLVRGVEKVQNAAG